ncbi:sporulation integral membrane protein YtvI [Geomicrobium sp. JCM 19039]|uniref:sporulation integral membrane protein YtvI n=1 Tax=Geomicrobium sp. JCM 19039 TaxID=1460636 RepID=UPI00045F2C00|nr:sporulation integral membrane protein YtvI [Geomicrobium sp. JCM 19039]GAK12782.1 membrane protein [Geomicrobium sp. JCM 19039]
MFNKTIVRRILIGIALIIGGLFVYFNFSALMPLLLALLTAMIFEPFVRFFKKQLKTEKRLLPVTIVFLLFVAISSIVLYLSITRLMKSIVEWSQELPQYAIQLQRLANDLIIQFNQLLRDLPQGYQIARELERLSEDAIDFALSITTNLVGLLGSFLSSVPNMLFVGLIYLITLFLFSLDLPRLLGNFFNFFKKETSNKLRYVFHRMGKVFLGWWKAQFILSLGVFILTYISLLYISPGPAFIMSVVIWVVDIIPLYVGPALVLAPWGILAMILGDVTMGIQLNILALVLLIIRRILEPKVLGDSIGMNALPTVLSMYFGFVFFGVMGLILGPFVYMAILSAKEAGLFELNLKDDEEKPEKKDDPPMKET